MIFFTVIVMHGMQLCTYAPLLPKLLRTERPVASFFVVVDEPVVAV